MSDKLAISAAFSVLMMAAYVLFGGETGNAQFGPVHLEAPTALSAPAFEVKALLR
jgi:hypothetical protein